MKGCRPLTDQEVEQTLQAFGGPYASRDRALFLLGVRSGFRISELLSLRLLDVCSAWQDRRSCDSRATAHEEESRRAHRVVASRSARGFEVWIGELRELGYMTSDVWVFQSRKGRNQAMSRVQAYRILHAAFERVGIEGTLGTHSMRKTFANRMYERLDHDLLKTQRALGHKNINSTVSYLSFRQEEIDEAILGM